MVKTCRVQELPSVAFHYGEAAASSGRWRATRRGDWDVDVYHHGCHMLTFHFDAGGWWDVTPRSSGRGSTSDRQGIGGMLRAVRCVRAGSYRELFGR